MQTLEILDGGTGEELLRLGLPDDRKIWSARALVEPQYHHLIKQVHQSFIEAGSNYITTSNYAVTPTCGLGDRIEKLTSIAGKLALEARDNCHQNGYPKAKILGCLPPLGESYRPDLILSREISLDCYRRIATTLLPFIDIFLAETLSCIDEALFALEAVLDVSPSIPIGISWTVQQDGCLRSGESAPTAIYSLLDFQFKNKINNLNFFAFNCSEPEAITLALKAIYDNKNLVDSLKQNNIRLGAYANRLVPVDPDYKLSNSDTSAPIRNDLSEVVYTNFAQQWRQLGASLIGGCCGVGPEHIKHLRKLNSLLLGF